MNLRQLKALEIAARTQLAYADGVWAVPSTSGDGPYRVVLDATGNRCTCDDFLLRGADGKHILAARLVRERERGGSAPALGTGTLPTRPTYRQNWPAYDQAQTTEKHRFRSLLCSLPLAAVETYFAIDSSGFSSSRWVRWYDEKHGRSRPGHDWVEAHLICGVPTNIVPAAEVLSRDSADAPRLPGLLEATRRHFTVEELSGDKAYSSVENVEAQQRGSDVLDDQAQVRGSLAQPDGRGHAQRGVE